MKVKYNRKSSVSQKIDRQTKDNDKYDLTINDTSSGSIPFSERDGGIKIISLINENKINEIVVSSIDRLGRSISDIIYTVEFFTEKKVNLFVEDLGLYSMTKGKINNTFLLISSVLGSVASIELNNLKNRQAQGIAIAKIKGLYKGRANGTKQTKEQFISKYKIAYNELLSGSTLKRASLLGECSINTCQRLKKLIPEN